MIERVLVANRGEIACRIMRSCQALGLQTVAVYSQADATSLHVEIADHTSPIGPPNPQQSYLVQDAILEAAANSGADAVHPGYGFLAENAAFAERVQAAGLAWIGPQPASIRAMGDKERARELARAAGVPTLPGSVRFDTGDLTGLEAAAQAVGVPLLVKAAAGGGGIGMRLVNALDEVHQVAAATQGMAARSFGDGTIYLERYIAKARHIEVQVFGFGDGRAVHLYERECSIQRRFQKIIEESPAPGLSPEVLAAMVQAALALTMQQRYHGAGTVEFVVDADTQAFFFLEMNTRIQVEHPVTEMVTGIDLVGLQIRLASGDALDDIRQADIVRNGHAVECRVYAEDPAKMFLPSPGTLDTLTFPPPSAGVRIDTGVRQGDQITIHYDPMIAKVIGHGDTRDAAIARTAAALDSTALEGLTANVGFLARTLRHPEFAAGNIDTSFVETHREMLLGR